MKKIRHGFKVSLRIWFYSILAALFTLGAEKIGCCQDLQWQQTVGGSGDEWGNSVQQTADGGYVITGDTDAFSVYPVILLKTDSSGNLEWQKAFGNVAGHGSSVQQTTDGGYIIAGDTRPYSGEYFYFEDAYLIKTDNSGNLEWQKTFGGNSHDRGHSVQQTTDGGYIIAGYTFSFGAGSGDVYLIKTDSLGNSEWKKTFGGYGDDRGNSVKQTTDSGYIIVGRSNSFGAGYDDIYLIKTDDSGNLQWEKTFGGSDYDQGYSVQQTTDGGYIIAGWTKLGEEDYDVYLIKTDSSGNLEWQKTFGGSSNDQSYSVQQITDGGYIITGWTKSLGAGYYDVYLIKADRLGNLQWEKTFGGSSSEWGYSVQQTTDGGYIIVGGTSSFGAGRNDVYLIKVSTRPTGVESGQWLMYY